MSVSNKYIDINKILGYKRVFNVLLSDRNAGKTYGVIKLLYKNFIDKGHKFIVLKRTVEDVKRTVGWGKKVAYYEYPTHDIKQNKNKIIIDGKEAGLFKPLSNSITLKDNDLFGYKYIFYDDCIIPFGSTKKYLKDEGLLLSELYITVDRNEDKTIMILCGNTISNTNPIFEFFNIKVSDKEYTFGKDYVVYKAKANTERLTTLENTRFGNLIKTNDLYNEYVKGNAYLQDFSGNLIDRKKMSFLCNIYLDNMNCVSVWETNKFIYVTDTPKVNGISYTKDIKMLSPNIQLFTKEILQFLKGMLEVNKIKYENENSVMLFAELF